MAEPTSALLATIDTSMGVVVARLFEHEAPETVATFVELASGSRSWRHPKTGQTQNGRPLHDGTVFHRVVTSFMIQAGDPLSSSTDGDLELMGTGSPGFVIKDEIRHELRFDRPGRLAMANAGRPDSNGSQWFITEVATPHLNGKHTIFGEVAKGFEIVPKISRVKTGDRGRPIDPVIIRSVRITRG